jgi:hypothetical protein
MTGHGEKLSRKKETAVVALLAAPTVTAAAAQAGIGERTLRRWLQTPEFKAAHRDARRQIVEASIARLQRATTDAVEALERNVRCGDAAVEVRAACAILDQLGKLDPRQMLSPTRALEFVDAVSAIVKRHVGEPTTLAKIANDLSALRAAE